MIEKYKKKKGMAALFSILLILLVALGCWTYYSYNPSAERVKNAYARIEAYIHYELLKDGKVVLRFDEDTVALHAFFMNRWAVIPSCGGRLAATYNHTLEQDRYLKANADSIFQQKADSLDSLYKDAQWKESEMAYYIRSHSPIDLGYNRICAYEAKEKALRDRAKKLIDSLKHIKKGNMQLVRRIEYRAFYRNEDGKQVSEPCLAIRQMDGRDTQGCHLFRLQSETTPSGIYGLAPRLAAALAIAHAPIYNEPIDYDQRPDSLGYYKGTVDSLQRPDGHGYRQDYDGTYYEGSWKEGKREGWGFSVSSRKPLRVGEWKADRYKGERLVYTSERIYGIDISKYQHEENKVVTQTKWVRRGRRRRQVKVKKVITHRYSIDWNRLRITHLGSISRKTVSGAVDFPIRYIYIKSTEGTSLVNAYYKADYQAAKAHGYKVGTYHFFSTLTPAAQQANHFLKHSHIRKGDFPPVLDVEPLPSQIKKMGGVGVLFSRVRTWLRLVERATGPKPILYVSQMFVNRYLSMAPDLKRDYQVWIARYGEYKPDIHLVYWQLCPDGRVAGIHGEVDINVFNGYKDTFDKFAQEHGVR